MKKTAVRLILKLLVSLFPFSSASALSEGMPDFTQTGKFGTYYDYETYDVLYMRHDIAVVNDADELWQYSVHLKTNSKERFESGDAYAVTKVDARKIADNVKMIDEHGGFWLKTDGSLWAVKYNYETGALNEPVKVMDGIQSIQGKTVGMHVKALGTDGTLTYVPNPYSHYPYEQQFVIDTGVDVLVQGENNEYYIKGNKVYSYKYTDPGYTPMLEQTLPFSDVEWFYVDSDNAFMVLSSERELWSWGQNEKGKLGNGGLYDEEIANAIVIGTIKKEYPVFLIEDDPHRILTDITEIWMGAKRELYAVDERGKQWKWGYGESPMRPVLEDNLLGPTRYPASLEGYSPVQTTVSSRCMPIDVYDFILLEKDGTIRWCHTDVNKTASLDGKWTEIGCWRKAGKSSQSVVPATPTEPAPSVLYGRFSDVPKSSYYYEAVEWAYDNKIAAGTGGDTFSPNRTCTRGDFITFLWRAMGAVKLESPNPYLDVPDDAYYADAAVMAYEFDIADAGFFNPNAPCTRAMAAEFFWKLFGCPRGGLDTTFSDVPKSSPYYEAVKWAVETGIAAGTGEDTFSPDQTCTRGQIVTFLWRMGLGPLE